MFFMSYYRQFEDRQKKVLFVTHPKSRVEWNMGITISDKVQEPSLDETQRMTSIETIS